MRYILLLRGINVGGKNKVAMSELKVLLESLNFENVHSYINSGNLFFSSILDSQSCISKIEHLLESNYDFSIPFTLLICSNISINLNPPLAKSSFGVYFLYSSL